MFPSANLSRKEFFLEITYLQVTTGDARGYGTLLQDAVDEEKTDFVRILLKHGFAFRLFWLLLNIVIIFASGLTPVQGLLQGNTLEHSATQLLKK